MWEKEVGRYKQRKGERELAAVANEVGNDADDWQSRVNAILEANLHRRVNGRVASNRTMEHNRTVIDCAFNTWHDKLNPRLSNLCRRAQLDALGTRAREVSSGVSMRFGLPFHRANFRSVDVALRPPYQYRTNT